MKRLRHWGPAAAWAILIWIVSTERFSSYSGHRLYLVLRWLLPGAAPATLQVIQEWVRHAAHVTEFFVFSTLLLRGVRGDRSGWKPAWGLAAFTLSAFYGLADEIHQAFVPSRQASALDVLRDTGGAALAQVMGWWRARGPVVQGGEEKLEAE